MCQPVCRRLEPFTVKCKADTGVVTCVLRPHPRSARTRAIAVVFAARRRTIFREAQYVHGVAEQPIRFLNQFEGISLGQGRVASEPSDGEPDLAELARIVGTGKTTEPEPPGGE